MNHSSTGLICTAGDGKPVLAMRKLAALFMFRINSRREQLAEFPVEENGCCLSWLEVTDRLDTATSEGSPDESLRGVSVRADGEGVNVRASLSSQSDGAIAEGLGCQILLSSA